MVIGVLFMLRSTPVASTDSDFERWVSLHQLMHTVDQLKDCHTRGQAVVKLENLPASVQPVG